MIFFVFAIQDYLQISQFALNNPLRIIISTVTILILCSGFCAGWFYMIKKALSITNDRVFVFDKDRNKALKEVFGSFFYGFGLLFLQFLFAGCIFLLFKAGIYILKPYKYLNIAAFVVISFVSYQLMLWVPEILYGTKNPIKAMINSTKKAINTFPRTIKLFLVMWFLFIGVYILFQLLLLNPILYFFVMLLNYYLIFFTAILVFTYYEQNFLK